MQPCLEFNKFGVRVYLAYVVSNGGKSAQIKDEKRRQEAL
jgi:hypothetical protein